MASMTEILFHYESGFVLDTLCRLFRSHLFPCNSNVESFICFLPLFKFCLLLELTLKLTLQKSTVHAWLFNKTEATTVNKQQQIEIKVETFIVQFTIN
jgi:hypothetical protein